MMGALADRIESAQNLFNFTVPFISTAFYCLLFLLMAVIYLIPFRWHAKTLRWGLCTAHRLFIG
jgi:hypothetical protein